MTLRFAPALVSITLLVAPMAMPTTAMAKTAAKPVVVEAPSGTYAIDLTHASIIWKVNHMGLSNYPARFGKFDGTLKFDAVKPENSTLSVNIDPTSVRTEYPDRDKEDFDAKIATGKDWFNSTGFPKITYVSRSIVRTGPKTADIIGDLTFLGVTKPVTLQATYNGSMKKAPFSGQPMLGFSATGKFKRSAFGMAKYIPTVGDEIALAIEAELMMQK
jgi:polyisoprenoid-binding protein YceI